MFMIKFFFDEKWKVLKLKELQPQNSILSINEKGRRPHLQKSPYSDSRRQATIEWLTND